MKGFLRAGALVVAFSFGFTTIAFAWTGPTASPPGNNTPAPINVSSTAQVKAGYLGVNGGYSGGTGFPFSVGGAANDWTGIFNWPYNTTPSNSNGILVGGGYSEFENPSGYYSYIAYSNYGLYTNGYIYAANSFGGGFGENGGGCAYGNPFTGGCSCPSFAPYVDQIEAINGQVPFVCY